MKLAAVAPILFVVIVTGCITGCGAGAPPAAPSARPAPATEQARCAVWSREMEFARSVLDHDAAGFAEHVLPTAVFLSRVDVLRGRDAIVAEWAPIVRGEGVILRWYPVTVEVVDGAGVAVSRGPFWIENTAPGATSKYLRGTFQTTWILDSDGRWRVAIDGGFPPAPATDAEIAQLVAAAPARCP